MFIKTHIYSLANHFFHWVNILSFEAILSFRPFGSCESTFINETLIQFVSMMGVAILCTNIHLTSRIKFTLEYLLLILITRFVHYFVKGSEEFFVSLNTCSIGSYIDEIIYIIGIFVILLWSITWAITTTHCAVIRITTNAVIIHTFTLLFWLWITIWNCQCSCFILNLWIQCLSSQSPFCIFCILNSILFLFWVKLFFF